MAKGSNCCTDGYKSVLHQSTKAVLRAVTSTGQPPEEFDVGPLDNKKFIVAFCGSGTGHLTQAMAVIQAQQKAGLTLAGVVTDTDASAKMLDEMVAPLNVPILQLPAIKIVDNNSGMVPIPAVVATIISVQGKLKKRAPDVLAFFRKTRPGLVLCFWHITFAIVLKLSLRPPPAMKIVNIAAQFALVRELTISDLDLPLEVVTMAVADTMAGIFASVGQCVAISPKGSNKSLPPILEPPPAIQPGNTPLILCYFLVQRDALQLEALLAKEYIREDEYTFGKCEFHCFTAGVLPTPKKRPLALHSHPKQRQLFQTLFSRCTGVIVSSGNETVWESVCRGVPVLTMPTTGHGEQLLNARVHGRNFPTLVRAVKPKGMLMPGAVMTKDDLLWIVQYEATAASIAESEELRRSVATFESTVVSRQVPALAPPVSEQERRAAATSAAVAAASAASTAAATTPKALATQPAVLLMGAGLFTAGMATMWLWMM
ncbi:hypothetical protein AB1Y20_001739 [Prymnesium parvum]|uniref:Monogalactosyldiacylglycerol synthase n=1 Tax=Prymnesium parvum TaxID=97485 RepID=A0AB34KE45_PRYPA